MMRRRWMRNGRNGRTGKSRLSLAPSPPPDIRMIARANVVDSRTQWTRSPRLVSPSAAVPDGRCDQRPESTFRMAAWALSAPEPAKDASTMVDPRASEIEQRLRRLKAVTDSALSQLELEDLLDELLERIRDLLSADTATVLLVDSSGRQLVATAAKGLEEEVRQGVRVPIGQGFAGTVAARGAPVSIEHVDPSNVVNPILVESVASVLG